MRKIIQHISLLAIVFGQYSLPAFNQTIDYASSKEKIYIQTSHVFFKQGETLYFKLYVVNAKDQTPAALSSIVYVELISPAGSVLEKLNYRVLNGYAEGSYEFPEQAVGGVYKIKAYTTWMLNENESAFFTKEITLQKVIAPRVLMKLDFPEKGYGAGSDVIANFSMRNLSDQPVKFFPAKFTVAVGGQQIQADDFKSDHEGKAKIKFKLPADLSTNDGLLNVIVNYDAYTEAISRSIPIVLDRIDLQFMPEGGTLVAGITTNIAFKALNENGKAADIKGEVWDSQGNRITSFESYHFGMGKFLFTPQKGERYKVKIISPANISGQFELPKAAESGVVMNFTKNGDRISVKLVSTDTRRVVLTGQTKSVNFYTKEILLQSGENNIVINESVFPLGIAQFTLLNANNVPLTERLMFLNEKKNLQVNISSDKKKYMPREKVTLTITTHDENGKPVPSNFSLAVMDDKLWTFADDKQDHILSWLLMSSELAGKIEEPQFYFKKEEPKSTAALDLVMLTHGYRYYDYTDFVKEKGELKFIPDQDNVLSGVVLDRKGIPVMANVYLASANPGGKGMQIRTDDSGMFFFSHLDPGTNYYVIAQALDKEKNVSIKILQQGVGYNQQKSLSVSKANQGERRDFVVAKPKEQVLMQVAEAKDEEKAKQLMAPFIGELKEHNLNEVVVTAAFGISRVRREMTGSVAMVRANEINGFMDVEGALAGKAAGVQVFNNANPGLFAKVRIRGARSLAGMEQPLYVLNGIPLEQLDFSVFNPGDIESITVLKDATATSLYGARAAQGAILIESKKFRNEKIRLDFGKGYGYFSQMIKISGPVYSFVKKFYTPKYKSTITDERSDFRETIYWNATVQTDKDGKAVVEFYNSDASTTFRAIAEGIGWNGKLGRAEATYAVQNVMTVDAKIPPYLTVGDTALIPLVIKNNSNDDLKIWIDIDMPAKFRSGTYMTGLTLNSDSSQQILIPFHAIAETKGQVTFIINNEFGTEKLVLPISAADKGFPVIETFSGNKSQQHNFTINKMVPGTLKANLKLFKNLEGQLLDGIESMLREPSGCFEQTSSCTYPNIYVLKYLKESGKVNAEIEKKARGYIERGYARLIGFETSQNGFEWFGKTPPHEALTAYGLLEFTDMKEFVKVDERMMKRTKEFLLSRRDGNGSFKLAGGGYDRFAAVPNKIANIYIVYALTQAGIGNEIQTEYQAAVKQALGSNDGYQLAMMALAASSMKNEKDFRQLMNELNELFQKGLTAETSVVNSRDASLRVETASLYALALMREASPNIGTIANLITRILSEKSYYGYGSTQSTVLALKAIVEYSKYTGRISENLQIDFIVNSRPVNGNEEVLQKLQEGANDFKVQYAEPDKNIPYSMEVSYNTLTPPNSEKADLQLKTTLSNNTAKVGETVRLEVAVTNAKDLLQPMAIAKIGIPAGLSAQPWQLKEIMEKNQAAYYEIFDNYVVFYWMGFSAGETKKINLDLKAEIPGTYRGKASTTYLYYTPEYKNWNDGAEIKIGR